jgi:hypothetical protein
MTLANGIVIFYVIKLALVIFISVKDYVQKSRQSCGKNGIKISRATTGTRVTTDFSPWLQEQQ